MKVLMLGWELPPYNSGGLGVACLQLTKALAASGADIDFIVPLAPDEGTEFMNVISVFDSNQKNGLDFFSYDSFRYHDGSTTRLLANAPAYEVYEMAVERLIENRDFDIIHAHDWLTFRAGLRAKELLGKPLVVHVHSVESDRAGGRSGNPFVREIESQAFHLADAIVAVSSHTKRKISEDYQIPLDKISVVHNSIDPSFFIDISPDNSYYFLSSLKAAGWQVVTNVGRLTVQKGLPHFIRAAADVVKFMPKTFFLFVGSGELRDELLLQAAELRIADKILFTGFLRGKQWRDAYSIADLFVMPSVSEPFGLTPLEAAGYGTPSLISKQSGVSEVFKSCLKVDFWDEREMANKIVGALKNSALHYEMSSKARNEYASSSWEESSSKMMKLYSELRLSSVYAK